MISSSFFLLHVSLSIVPSPWFFWDDAKHYCLGVVRWGHLIAPIRAPLQRAAKRESVFIELPTRYQTSRCNGLAPAFSITQIRLHQIIPTCYRHPFPPQNYLNDYSFIQKSVEGGGSKNRCPNHPPMVLSEPAENPIPHAHFFSNSACTSGALTCKLRSYPWLPGLLVAATSLD